MIIRLAKLSDADILLSLDRHICIDEINNSISLGRIYVIEINSIIVGWLRYNLFWDNTPFMNMLYVLEEYRNKKYGTSLVLFWENEMRKKGYSYLLLSTPSNEESQFFYEKIGYNKIGGFTYRDDPYEIVMAKEI